MRVRVDAVFVTADGLNVRFSCAIGGGEGLWVGREPASGAEYSVELGLREPTTIVAIAGNETCARVESTREGVVIRGRVEHIASDGVVDLRVGDGILLVDAPCGRLTVGDCLEVRSSRLSLYDSDT